MGSRKSNKRNKVHVIGLDSGLWFTARNLGLHLSSRKMREFRIMYKTPWLPAIIEEGDIVLVYLQEDREPLTPQSEIMVVQAVNSFSIRSGSSLSESIKLFGFWDGLKGYLGWFRSRIMIVQFSDFAIENTLLWMAGFNRELQDGLIRHSIRGYLGSEELYPALNRNLARRVRRKRNLDVKSELAIHIKAINHLLKWDS